MSKYQKTAYLPWDMIIYISVFGLIFIAGAITAKYFDDSFFRTGRSVTAVISNITRERSLSDDSYDYDVTVSYMVEGKKMEADLSYYSSSMHVGDPIEVYYQPDNPSKVKNKTGASIGFWIFLSFGLVMILIPLTILIVRCVTKFNRSRLKRHGIVLKAKIDELEEDTSTSMNDHHPFIIYCSACLPDGTKQTFRSSNAWYEREALERLSTVCVYVHPHKYSRYYVDVDGAVEKL